MKPAYEIVQAFELRMGDVLLDLRGGAVEPYVVDSEIVDIARGAPKDFYPPKVRQLPPERNPEVLEKALELAVDYMSGDDKEAQRGVIKEFIEDAIRELESEAQNGQ